MMAVALVAFGASSAAAVAETPIEVTSELSGVPCNPCTVHAAGNGLLTTMNGLIVLSDCSVEVTAQIYSDGTGEIHQQEMSGANCQMIACNGVGEAASESEWAVEDPLEMPSGRPRMRIKACFDNPMNPNGTGTHCTLVADVLEAFLQPHVYTYSLVPTNCLTGQISGSFLLEASCCGSEAIEITHL
jgi:hypothetical protein